MEEEISLRELIEVLLKRKWMIVGITVIAVIAAGLISMFVLDEKYEAMAQIKINEPIDIEVPRDLNVPDQNMIINDSLTKVISITEKISLQRLNAEINNMTFLNKLAEKLDEDVTADRLRGDTLTLETDDDGSSDIVTLKVSYDNPEGAKNMADTAAEQLSKQISAANIQEVESSIENLSYQINEIETAIENDNRDVDLSSLQVEKRQRSLENIYEGLIQKREEMKVAESLLNRYEPVSVIAPAFTPENPTSPNTKLNLAIAMVLGLMVGVFGAFFREYWTATGEEKEDDDEKNKLREQDGE